jgi:hypothetical protein
MTQHRWLPSLPVVQANPRLTSRASELGHRRGAVLILTALLLVFLLGLAALAVDLGVAYVAGVQLQRTADAGALAGGAALLPSTPGGHPQVSLARQESIRFATLNPVLGQVLELDENWSNDPEGDIVFGRVDPENPQGGFTPTTSDPNALRVMARKQLGMNGPVNTFFAQIFGIAGIPVTRSATAMITDKVVGFRDPGQETLDLLPFAVKLEDWLALLGGSGLDNYSYNPRTRQVSRGRDGLLELRIYPQTGHSDRCCKGTVAGNFGTVDIGSPDNSTATLKRQIRYGVSSEDLAYHGGELKLGPNGTLVLNGDTGISAGIESAVQEVIGRPKVILLYSSVRGNGNNASFTIVGFAGVRVMDVKLSGSVNSKYILVQPANVVSKHAIPGNSQKNYYVYAAVRLID